eukprot:477250-Rhodomonas_salina.2
MREQTSLAESPGEKALHELAVAAGLSSPAAPCPRDLREEEPGARRRAVSYTHLRAHETEADL